MKKCIYMKIQQIACSSDISIQFALFFSPVRLYLHRPLCVLPISIPTCHSPAHLFSASSALSCNSLSQISISIFFSFFFLSSAYKPGTLPRALPRSWKWRESGRGVITMSIHKHRTPRDCTDESTNATGKLPTLPGQVIYYATE